VTELFQEVELTLLLQRVLFTVERGSE